MLRHKKLRGGLIGWLVALISQRSQFSAQQAGLTVALLLLGSLTLSKYDRRQLDYG
jgi:hypothetical protein